MLARTVSLLIALLLSSGSLAGVPSESANNGSNGGCGSGGRGPSHAGNPMDIRSGNKYQVERLFSAVGEMPLKFNWFYNSRHFQTGLCEDCGPEGSGVASGSDIIGQWTHSYSSHLMIDPTTVGTGSAIVELRLDDGKSIWFIEQGTTAGDLVPQEPESCGFLKTTGVDAQTQQYYTGYEYQTKDGTIQRYDADGYLVEIENVQGVKQTLTRNTVPVDASNNQTTVTVTRSLGGQISFDYIHPANDDDYENSCFRCANSLTDPDGYDYGFTINALGLLTAIDYPSAQGGNETLTKTFLYEIDDTSFTGGCSAFWQCETALTGIIDEEGQRYATWDYKNEQDYYIATMAPDNVGWVYKSYHGEGADIDDHVEVIGYNGSGSLADDRVVVYQYAHKEHWDIDHWDESNENYGDDRVVNPRTRSIQDLNLDPDSPSVTPAENIEQQGTYYDYYDAGTPSAQAALKTVKRVTELNGTLVTTSTHYEYDNQGAYLVEKMVETSGDVGSEVIERVTDQRWNPQTRQLLWKRISEDGTAATAELEVHYTYYANGRLQSITETDLTQHQFPYSTANRQRTWNYSYTYHDAAQTRVASMTIDGPRTGVADITTLTYDTNGNMVSMTNALGHTLQYQQHNSLGLPGLIVDASGVQTLMTYNPRGQVTRIERDNAVTTFTYYKNGLLKRRANPDNSWIETTYTSAHNIKSIQNNFGERVVFDRVINPATGVTTITTSTYDASNNLFAQQISKEDAKGRLYQTLGASGQATEYHYYGNLLATVKSSGHAIYGDLIKTFDYDGLYRLTRVIDPKQTPADPDSQTRMSYTVNDRLVSVIDPTGLETLYQYDGFGFLMQRTSPQTGDTLYTYDDAGNLLTQTEANGTAYDYAYDALNRPVSKSKANSAITTQWEYDLDDALHTYGVGRLSRIEDESGTTDYGYDNAGRIAHVSTATNLPNGSINYALDYSYDDAGNQTSITYPSGQVIHYDYSDGRLTAIRSTQNGVVSTLASSITHKPFGGVDSLLYGNGLLLSKQFDLDGRLSETLVAGGVQSLQHVNVDYDAFDNVAAITDQVHNSSQTFVYDHLHRLEQANGVYGQLTYEYDAVGNRLSRTQGSLLESYSYHPATGQLLTIDIDNGGATDQRALSYDASGNTIKDETQPKKRTLEYDANNRLIRILEQQ